jgi:hypothetical protein
VPSYDQEKWMQLFKLALLELEHSLMSGCIADARGEIEKRITALRDMPGIHEEQRQAIEDALSSLRYLEREEVKPQAEEQRERAEAALQKLRSIAPKIERNKASK